MLPSFDISYDNCCHRNFTNKIFPQEHIASLGIDLYQSVMQYAERNKVTAYFCCKDKRLLGDFVLEHISNEKYWMSFIALFSGYTVYS